MAASLPRRDALCQWPKPLGWRACAGRASYYLAWTSSRLSSTRRSSTLRWVPGGGPSTQDACGSGRSDDRDDHPSDADRRTRGDHRRRRRRPQRCRLGRRNHLRRSHECGPGARPLSLPLRSAEPGRLGDPCSGNARRGRRGTGRALFRTGRAGNAAGVTRGRRPWARRGRWMGRATHKDDGEVGCALRRRGRCVPDPRPQRVRRAHGRRVGARDRRGALRVPRSWVAAAVDA